MSVYPLFALVAFLAVVLPPAANAWDIGDSPSVAAHASADLGDAFFFLDPNNNTVAIMAVTLRGPIVIAQNANFGFFDPAVKIRFEIENTGDAKADEFIEVRFEERLAPEATQTARIKTSAGKFTAPTTISRVAFGPQGAPTFGGGTSAQQFPVITTDAASGISFFGGLIDDPFYFDAAAFEAYRNSRMANQINPAILTRGRDGFAGYNTMAIVLSVPVSSLVGPAGTVVGLSVSAKGPAGAKDRVAHPFVNTLLVNYEDRDAYNAAKPIKDAQGKFVDQIIANMQALQTDSTSTAIIAEMASTNGDILRLNTAIANTGTEGGKNAEAAYPNGRRPNDDVVDTIITLLNNRVFQGDAVNDNELPMRDSYPFFAQPHMPFPPGADDMTRN